MDQKRHGAFVIGLIILLATATGAVYLGGSVSSSSTGTSSIYAADVNADNRLDVISASSNRNVIAWYRNEGGSFSNHNTIKKRAGGVEAVFAGDLDGDGDADIVSSSIYTDRIVWYENTDGYGSFSTPKVIEKNGGNPQSVFTADLDGDDDSDLLFASAKQGKIAWYSNKDGKGTFSDQSVISSNVKRAQAVYAADLDSDGDLDALSASSSFGGVDKIAWYRNTAGGFASQSMISKKMNGARSVFAADVDGDDDQDVLSASKGDGKVAWYENTSGYGTFSKQKVITNNAKGARSVVTADLDGDGDSDALSAGKTLAWYENTDGSGSFSGKKVIAGSGPYGSVIGADLDADGDPDVLSASEDGNRVAWYSNDIEQGQGFGTAQSINQSLAQK